MRFANLILCSTVLVACASPAQAAGQPFTGVRIEANLGYDLLNSPDHLDGSDDNIPDRLESARAGVAAGYDWAIGPRVTISAEIGIGTSVVGGTRAEFGSDMLRISAGRDIDVSARLGFRVAARTLVFAKAGFANSRLRVELKEAIGATYETDRYSEGASAVRVGAGIEHVLRGPLYLKAEYRWSRYGDDLPYQNGSNRHQLLAGAGIRF
jgi:outer membrane immunogenic protein